MSPGQKIAPGRILDTNGQNQIEFLPRNYTIIVRIMVTFYKDDSLNYCTHHPTKTTVYLSFNDISIFSGVNTHLSSVMHVYWHWSRSSFMR
jgi:hypothetical protein